MLQVYLSKAQNNSNMKLIEWKVEQQIIEFRAEGLCCVYT